MMLKLNQLQSALVILVLAAGCKISRSSTPNAGLSSEAATPSESSASLGLSDTIAASRADIEKYASDLHKKPTSHAEFTFKAAHTTAFTPQGGLPDDTKVFLAFGETTLTSRHKVKIDDQGEMMAISFAADPKNKTQTLVRVCLYPHLDTNPEDHQVIDTNNCKYGGFSRVNDPAASEKLLQIAASNHPFHIGLKLNVANLASSPDEIPTNNTGILWFGEVTNSN